MESGGCGGFTGNGSPSRGGRRGNGKSHGDTRKKRRSLASESSQSWRECAVVACVCGDCVGALETYDDRTSRLARDLSALVVDVLGTPSSTSREIRESRTEILRGMRFWEGGRFKIQYSIGDSRVRVCAPTWAALPHYPPTVLPKHARLVLAGGTIQCAGPGARGHQMAPTLTEECQGRMAAEIAIIKGVAMGKNQIEGKTAHVPTESLVKVAYPRYLIEVGKQRGFDEAIGAYHGGDMGGGAAELYKVLKEGGCHVISYSSFCKARKQLVGGGLKNPKFGLVSGAKENTEIIPGVPTRQHMAFSGHAACCHCSFIDAKLSQPLSISEREYWIRMKGLHNFEVKQGRVYEQQQLASGACMGADKTAKSTSAAPSINWQRAAAWNSKVRGSQYQISIYVWFAYFGEFEVWGAIIIPPWVKSGANLTCTLRFMSLQALETLGIPIPANITYEADGGSDELGSITGFGFLGAMVHDRVVSSVTPFRQQPKHTHFICDQTGGVLRLDFMGNRSQWPRYCAYTPREMERNTRQSMERMHPNAIVDVRVCNAAHDWSGVREHMEQFTGIMSARKFKLERRAVGGDSGGAASTTIYATPYESAPSETPMGCTLSGQRIEDSFPVFSGDPVLPTAMQGHDEAGLAAAKVGIETCEAVLQQPEEGGDPSRYFARRAAGGTREYDEIIKEKLLDLSETWLPAGCRAIPPAFSEAIPHLPHFEQAEPAPSSAAAVATARLASLDVLRPQVHIGGAGRMIASQRAVCPGFAIVVCKESEGGPTLALAKVEEIGSNGELKLRWFKGPSAQGKCKHDFYNSSETCGPPQYKILHSHSNLVAAGSGRANSQVSLTEVGKRWWAFAETNRGRHNFRI